MLFFGDSFMEGYDDKNTLPYHVAKYFKDERGICLKTHNAGYTSYSPSIFIPQAKKLLPIVQPDYVVIDIDETDFYDDFARYRKLVTRNERGENVGVKVSPIGHACSVGLMEVRQHALYLSRLAAKLWLSYVSIPDVIEANRSKDLEIFSWSKDHSPDIDRKYPEARAVFRHNLEELTGILEGLRPGRRACAVHLPSASQPSESRCLGPGVERSGQFDGAASLRGKRVSVLQRHRHDEGARRIEPGAALLALDRHAFQLQGP